MTGSVRHQSMDGVKLDKVASILNARLGDCEGKKRVFTVGDCYRDFGSGVMWTTIMCDSGGGFGGYQFLYPNDWEALKKADTDEAVGKVIDGLVARVMKTGY